MRYTMNGRGLALIFPVLMACGGHTSSDDDGAGAANEVLIKLEWGSSDAGGVGWVSQVALSGAKVLRVEPYAFESGDTLVPDTLNVYSWTEGFLSDGLLLDLTFEDPATLVFYPGFGESPVVGLKGLVLDRPQFFVIDGTRYLEVSRIDQDEWDTALSYGRYESTRTDTLPRIPYEANAIAYRYNSVESLDTIAEKSLERYETDAFFAHAEDLRRAVNQQLYVTVPSVLELGENFDITVAAFDINGHPVTDFDGEVSLSVQGANVVLPPSIYFSEGEASIVTEAGAGVANEAGYALIQASDPSGRFGPGAIPVRIEEKVSERIYWGDIHTHSRLSDGDFGDIGPDDVFAFGRDVARLDFVAVTDHDYRRPIPDWKWLYHKSVVKAFNEPNSFVTLLAYEWSAEDMRYSDGVGHKNVYFRSDDAPVYSSWDPRFNTPDKLWAALREEPGVGNVLTVPHHPVRKIELTEEQPQYGGIGTDWQYHDEDLQTLVEVYSRWGISETNDPDNPRPVRDARNTGSAQYAVGLGYRLGFIASTDTHDGEPGVSVLPARQSINAYPVGTVAVMAPELTRDAIFDGLLERQCYGTSGGRRILMDFRTSEGLGIGDVGEMKGAPSFEIEIAGTTRLTEISLIRVENEALSTVVWQEMPSGWYERVEVTDEDYKPEGAYYVRVVQEDNEMGWVGPIFLQME